jgi:hypothetical protein
MRSNQFAVVLAGLLAISTLVTAWLTLYYFRSVRKIAASQPQVIEVSKSRDLINHLIADTMEYSKQNKEIDPLLQGMGLKASSKVSTPAQPPNRQPGSL